MNARARKSAGGDAGPRCRRGARLRRAGRHRGEARFAAGGNPVNPRIGSGMKQARAVAGGGNRRGGEKPRGRNVETAWQPAPDGRPETVGPEWTPRLSRRWRGVLWTNPGEEPDRQVGRHGPGRCRERRREGQEGCARSSKSGERAVRAEFLGGPRGVSRARSRRRMGSRRPIVPHGFALSPRRSSAVGERGANRAPASKGAPRRRKPVTSVAVDPVARERGSVARPAHP